MAPGVDIQHLVHIPTKIVGTFVTYTKLLGPKWHERIGSNHQGLMQLTRSWCRLHGPMEMMGACVTTHSTFPSESE